MFTKIDDLTYATATADTADVFRELTTCKQIAFSDGEVTHD